MNRILIYILLLVVGFTACKKKHENSIKDIKEKVNKINSKLADYTKRQVDDLTSREGGNITGFYRDEEVKKIYAQHFGTTSRSFTEYYFDDGMLIYVLKQDYIYNRPNNYTEDVAKAKGDSVWYDDRKTRLAISRFFFNDNIMIKWVNSDKVDVPVNSPEFLEKQSSLWAETIILIKQLKEQQG
jgi:hypothetical protein